MAGKDVDDGIRELKEKRGWQTLWSCSPARDFGESGVPPPGEGAVKQYRAVDLPTRRLFPRSKGGLGIL